MSSNRRDFIKFVVAGALAPGCPVDLALFRAPTETATMVEGEENKICHQMRDGKAFSRPPVSARHDVVIVGGGISGLTAAYLLQNRDFLLLEKEPHFGGNAYLMEFEGQAYATGSAFVDNEVVVAFAREIGLEPLPVNNFDPTIVNGEFVADTWGDGIDKLPYSPAVRDSFKKFRREFLAIDYPTRKTELYNTPLTDLLRGYPPELQLWWDGFGASSWGSRSEDSPAAPVVEQLQWMAAPNRKDDRYTWPGGLGALSKRLVDVLQPKHGDRMLTNATIIAVATEKGEVSVTYMQGPELKTVSAKSVIMATPKYITRRIVEGIPEKQDEAMQQMRYIPYVIVNLIFDKGVYRKGFDNWCPGNSFTDFIVADWVIRNQPGYHPKYNILSCYAPLHEEDRRLLLTEPSARKVAGDVLKDFQKLFPGSNVDPIEVHLYRRGHPMYMTTPGLYTKVQPLLRQPMDRVFFANTDSEGPFSSATYAITGAGRVVKEVEHRLAGRIAPKPAPTGKLRREEG
ncbi:MAG TPA: FAD-dependent oxidoreductase [Terriglobales bacterium]|nr:FAD-dependent oxidoreductase [Terriglobales bacterium]